MRNLDEVFLLRNNCSEEVHCSVTDARSKMANTSSLPKRSSLETDDGFHVSQGASDMARSSGLVSRGMDVCDSAQICDSGVGLMSVDYEKMSGFDQVKRPLADDDLERHTTFDEVDYTLFGGPETAVVDSGIEGQLEELCISSRKELTARTTCLQTTTADVTSQSTVTVCSVPQYGDLRAEFIDRLKLYYTPDDDGDT